MIPEFLSALLHMYENQKHYKGLCRNYLRLDGITCNMFRPVGFLTVLTWLSALFAQLLFSLLGCVFV